IRGANEQEADVREFITTYRTRFTPTRAFSHSRVIRSFLPFYHSPNRQYVRDQLHVMNEEFPAYKLSYELHGLESPLPEEDETDNTEDEEPGKQLSSMAIDMNS